MVSILNDVLGPIMRGPSSSHTAGSHRIATLAAALLGTRPASARFVFDASGSYGQVYREQGADMAFAAGILGIDLADERYFSVFEIARDEGVEITFGVEPLETADHPNHTVIRLNDTAGSDLEVKARSIGGGAIEITAVGNWPVKLNGDCWHTLVEVDAAASYAVEAALGSCGQLSGDIRRQEKEGLCLMEARGFEQLPSSVRRDLAGLPGVRRVREVPPVGFVRRGEPLFSSGAEMVALAERRHLSLGRVAVDYESALLGLPKRTVLAETRRRLEVMRESARAGLDDRVHGMQLLAPTASGILRAEKEGRLALGGPHLRAAARAMAVMHVNAAMGVVCAAPTGGSAGVLAGVVSAMVDEQGVDPERAALALLAAGAIGVIVGSRATFAAEVAGCQVEIGAAGAMAAAAVVEEAGGTAREAADAAAISLQNTMGSVCDLVQGVVEIPCHTRNAAAASGAFLCADLVLGGYANPIPLDETIDAVYAVGRMMPAELRCTARGGLAVTPSALEMVRRSSRRHGDEAAKAR
ncbi:MAG: L-serine ammonia-lyase, iron-sulfur-dependent, subunit alpha [Vicinamibacterales bacterium]